MKQIQIEIRVDEKSGKIATIWKTNGYSENNIHDQLELLGLMENTKSIINTKIKTLLEKKL